MPAVSPRSPSRSDWQSFFEAAAQFLWKPDFKMIENPIVSGKIAIGEIFISFPQLVSSMIAVLSLFVLNWFVTKTSWGLALQAVSENREWAKLMGIDSEKMFNLSWGIGIACIAMAGVLLTNFFYIFPQVGLSFTMIAFVTVALGGFGSIYGTLIAALLIGLVESIGGYYLGAQYKTALIFVLYLSFITIRPRGVAGRF
jgi:branched-chain amino acid transport system permease protein